MMSDLFFQILALFGLVTSVAIGYRRWVAPHRSTLTRSALGLLTLLVLTFMGGLLGGLFWWFDAPQSFAWDLPPLAARMLAVAGWTFAVLTAQVLERPTLPQVRLALILLNIYLAPLVAAALIFHRSRLDFAAPITYGFLLIAGGMTLAGLWYLIRPPALQPAGVAEVEPPARVWRIWLGLAALVLAAWGLALFITDSGPLAPIWVWPGDLLTSRLIAVMLWAMAAGAFFAQRYTDTTRLMLSALVTYGLGVTVANAWSALVGKPIQLAYLAGFGVMGLISLLGLWRRASIGIGNLVH